MLHQLILLSLLFLSAYSCPDGSVEWKDYCYIFNANETGFAKAETICAKNGGHLVSIHDAFINSIVGQYASDFFHASKNTNFWIGLNSISSKNVWKWTDESSFDFNDWKKGEPKNLTGKECVSASMNDGYWKTENCFSNRPFVCGIALSATTKIPTTTSTIPIDYPKIKTCSSGWTYYERTNSSYCFSYPSYFSWQSVEDYCVQLGGHLASIHSEEENRLLNGVQGDFCSSTWIGLYTNDNGTTYQWSDGSNVNYFYWDPLYPNTYYGTCVVLDGYCNHKPGLFKNSRCGKTLYGVCKK